MKKALLIALLAMMLISVVLTACKPKVEEAVDEVAPVEEVAPADTMVAPAADAPAAPVAPAGK
ncbi:MAG: hypothetical protein CVU50_09520 [Candidatus Cloacimonetes bacterium HGW-Cloacimonetes-3]|nr:MAG: hypothetical protein CVU50_09520 [Candidatus Cloacimonetes bacterium HGW-Cloacimonetes-3]